MCVCCEVCACHSELLTVRFFWDVPLCRASGYRRVCLKSFFVSGPWATLQDDGPCGLRNVGKHSSDDMASHLSVQFVPVPAFCCGSQPELLSSALEAVC